MKFHWSQSVKDSLAKQGLDTTDIDPVKNGFESLTPEEQAGVREDYAQWDADALAHRAAERPDLFTDAELAVILSHS